MASHRTIDLWESLDQSRLERDQLGWEISVEKLWRNWTEIAGKWAAEDAKVGVTRPRGVAGIPETRMSRGHLAHEKSFINLWNAAAMCLEWHVNEFKWLKLKEKKNRVQRCLPRQESRLHATLWENSPHANNGKRAALFCFPHQLLKKNWVNKKQKKMKTPEPKVSWWRGSNSYIRGLWFDSSWLSVIGWVYVYPKPKSRELPNTKGSMD